MAKGLDLATVQALLEKNKSREDRQFVHGESPETFPCSACGHCSTPEQCVASIDCPECGASRKNLCRDIRGAYVGYHEERWQLVYRLYGTYYKEI